MHQWYYLIGEADFGPLSTDELRAALKGGELGLETYVYRVGLEGWIQAKDCKDLIQLPPLPSAKPAVVSLPQKRAGPNLLKYIWWPRSNFIGALLIFILVVSVTFNLVSAFWHLGTWFAVSYIIFSVIGKLTDKRRSHALSVSLDRQQAKLKKIRWHALGAGLGFVVAAMLMQFDIQIDSAIQHQLSEEIEGAQQSLNQMESPDYRNSLVVEGFIRGAAGDLDGGLRRVDEELSKINAFAGEAQNKRAAIATIQNHKVKTESIRIGCFLMAILAGIVFAWSLFSRTNSSPENQSLVGEQV